MPEALEQNKTLKSWLTEAPFSLAMSSGFFGFYAHAGFIKALEANALKPSCLHGASAGALTAALWAAGLKAKEIVDQLQMLQRRDFWDPFPGPGILRGKKFADKLSDLLPVKNFAECKTPLFISVFDPIALKTVSLTSGCLATAIRASCAVPIMFHPVWREKRPYLDGGILDRPGIAGALEGERMLYHHLQSQSFWRRKKARSSLAPNRTNLRTVVVPGLPRVSPFKLAEGRRALNQAYDYTMHLLEKT
jgi:NTE family protein